MNSALNSYNLTPAGYLIVQAPKQAMHANECLKEAVPYFGVDRLPPFIAPDLEIRQLLGKPVIRDEHARRALERWFEIQESINSFIPNQRLALQLQRDLQGLGYELELIYCQLAWQKGDEDRVAIYAETESTPPNVTIAYGFDVSWPNCNHSAIIQPGIVGSEISWRKKLNAYGLLASYEDAVRLRQDYIASYPYPPFDIYLVHKTGSQ